jgi:hypothetical protein
MEFTKVGCLELFSRKHVEGVRTEEEEEEGGREEERGEEEAA